MRKAKRMAILPPLMRRRDRSVATPYLLLGCERPAGWWMGSGAEDGMRKSGTKGGRSGGSWAGVSRRIRRTAAEIRPYLFRRTAAESVGQSPQVHPRSPMQRLQHRLRVGFRDAEEGAGGSSGRNWCDDFGKIFRFGKGGEVFRGTSQHFLHFQESSFYHGRDAQNPLGEMQLRRWNPTFARQVGRHRRGRRRKRWEREDQVETERLFLGGIVRPSFSGSPGGGTLPLRSGRAAPPGTPAKEMGT
jgi:hypothetical protein